MADTALRTADTVYPGITLSPSAPFPAQTPITSPSTTDNTMALGADRDHFFMANRTSTDISTRFHIIWDWSTKTALMVTTTDSSIPKLTGRMAFNAASSHQLPLSRSMQTTAARQRVREGVMTPRVAQHAPVPVETINYSGKDEEDFQKGQIKSEKYHVFALLYVLAACFMYLLPQAAFSFPARSPYPARLPQGSSPAYSYRRRGTEEGTLPQIHT